MKISCVSLRFWCSYDGELLEARDPRLALRLPALGVLPHPLELLLHRLDARAFLLRLDLEPRLLLLQPRAVVALPRDAVAAVELEDPLGGVVEEVAVVRHRDHGAGKLLQELLEPVDALGVEVVGRLVEQQHVGLRQQQPAQRDAPLLAAGQRGDLRVPRRQPQRVGGDFHLHVAVGAARGDDRLVLRLLGGELVEVGVGLRVRGVDLLEPLLRAEHVAPCPSRRSRARFAPDRAAAPAAGSRCACSASAPLRPRTPCPRRP